MLRVAIYTVVQDTENAVSRAVWANSLPPFDSIIIDIVGRRFGPQQQMIADILFDKAVTIRTKRGTGNIRDLLSV